MNKEIKTLEDLENFCKKNTGHGINIPPFVYINKYFEDIEKAYGNGYRAGYKEAYSDLCLRASKADGGGRMKREEAIQYLTDTGISPEHIMELVEALSSSEKPKMGQWIVEAGDRETDYGGCTMCSECAGEGNTEMDYCPNCGAKMTESEDEES